MANHPQFDATTKADLSDRSQAISGPSSDLSSLVWQDMRSEKSGYLDAQPKRFSLSDNTPSSTSKSGTDSAFSIRSGVCNDSTQPSSNALPNIEFFD
ncbi:hypothetical protein KBI23_01190 [bacterium]|nr:hypothetical protein [bacterium]MBP9808879.1 hypothetical protein [bacterium]